MEPEETSPDEALRLLFAAADPLKLDPLASVKTITRWTTRNYLRAAARNQPPETIEAAMVRFQVLFNRRMIRWMEEALTLTRVFNKQLEAIGGDWATAQALSEAYKVKMDRNPAPVFDIFNYMEEDCE